VGLKRTLTSLIGGAVLLAAARPASGQCPVSADQVLTFPDSGENDVPTNVVVRVELPVAAPISDEVVWSVTDEEGAAVDGTIYWDGLTTSFTPDDELEPGTTYSCTVTRGWDRIGSFYFITGDGMDDSRPSFQGVVSIDWEYRTAEWLRGNCSSYRGGGHLFELTLAEVADETHDSELCYHIYRSAGPDLSGPRLEARTRIDGDGVRVFVPEGAGDGRHCFHVEVQDLAGRFDTNVEEVCADVIAGALFGNICSVAAPAPGPSRGGLWLMACLGLVLVVRRLRRHEG
jgi:MYXO-CTERM domain-containing protein